MTIRHDTCVLCGHTDHRSVHVRLVDWKEPVNGSTFGHVPRCDKTDECRARVEGAGEQWEVRVPSWSPSGPRSGRGNLADIIRELGGDRP